MPKPFTRRFDGPRLSPEQAARQGRASTLAFKVLGSAGAIAFLNGHDEELGGRPIDLAVSGVDGLAAVERALADRPQG